MNVYDFDKTIYDGDSTLDFYLFCLKKQPMLLRFLPYQCGAFLVYCLGMIDKTQFKQCFYSFLRGVSQTDQFVEEFWCQSHRKIKPWYLQRQEKDDVIISASPEFLLLPICRQLNIQFLLASSVDQYSGICTGANCYGQEKVVRFRQKFGDRTIDEFYSDSLSDSPLAELAQKSYIVGKKSTVPWNEYRPSTRHKLKRLFLSKEFVAFLMIGVLNTINGIVFAYAYSQFLDVNLAFILGYITSLTISYLLNSFITFKESLGPAKYVKFCISYIPNFIIQNIVVLFFYNGLGFHKLFTYSLAALLGVPITFLFMKVFAFRKKH